ncbi:major facilitator superfamily domain-containing protein, partial [Phascolomyces articulosus]
YPALPSIQAEFNTTTTVTNMNISVHTLMIGLLSAIWGSYADGYGRRPIFIASNAFLVCGNIGSALAINNWMLLAFRIITAVGAAASNALGAGMINDVFEDHQKGKVISWFSCASLYTMGFSPFVGGALNQYLGWRWIFWIFVIVYGLLWITIILLLPETNPYARHQRRQQQNDSIESGDSSSTYTTEIKGRTHKKASIINPFSSLKLLKFPNMLLCLALSFTWAYSNQYHFSSTFVGLFYLSGLVGTTTASYLGGFLSDKIYMRRMERVKNNSTNENEQGQAYPEMRLSQSVIFVAAFVLAVSYVGYGWGIEKNVHFSAGIICQTFGKRCLYNITCITTFTYLYIEHSLDDC